MDTGLRRCDDNAYNFVGSFDDEGPARLAYLDLRQEGDGARAYRDFHGDSPRLCRARLLLRGAARRPAALRQYAVRPAPGLGPIRIPGPAGDISAQPARSTPRVTRCATGDADLFRVCEVEGGRRGCLAGRFCHRLRPREPYLPARQN